jgi:hypothetical protein
MCFEVIPPFPLLQLSIGNAGTSLPLETLQGQLLMTNLIIKNEGNAVAAQIHLKANHPGIVFFINGSKDASLMSDITMLPLWGESGTITRLPTDTTIGPGQEMNIRTWIRMTGMGKQNISILASYVVLREDGKYEMFGSTEQPRISYLNVETNVVPSCSLNARIVSRPTSLKERVFMLDISNRLPEQSATNATSSVSSQGHVASRNASAKDFSLRDSSVGQYDFDLSGFSEEDSDYFNDESFRVEGVQFIGAACPISHPKVTQKYKNLNLGRGEAMTLCLPFSFSDDCVYPTNSWAMELGDAYAKQLYYLDRSSNELIDATVSRPSYEKLKIEIKSVVERFLCLNYLTKQHKKKMNVAKRNYAIEKIESDHSGPRSIAQVRRDAANKSVEALDSVNLNDNANDDQSKSNEPSLLDLSFENNGTHSGSLESCFDVPMSLEQMYEIEKKSFCMSAAVMWSCKWKDHVVFGVHYLNNMSILMNTNASKVQLTAGKGRHGHPYALLPSLGASNILPMDALMISVAHDHVLNLPTSARSVLAPIKISLRSLADNALAVTIEAVDRRNQSSAHASGNYSHISLKYSPLMNHLIKASLTMSLQLIVAMSRRPVMIRVYHQRNYDGKAKQNMLV